MVKDCRLVVWKCFWQAPANNLSSLSVPIHSEVGPVQCTPQERTSVKLRFSCNNVH